MLTIDLHKAKDLEFSISLVGRFSGKINAYFRIYLNNFNIGFPAKISNFQKVSITIPKISEIVNPSSVNDDGAYASLEIISDRDIFLAWQDKVKIKNTHITASLEDEKEEKEPTIVATLNEPKNEAILKLNIDKEPIVIKNKKTSNRKESINESLKIDLTNIVDKFKPNTDDIKNKYNEKIHQNKRAYDIADVFKNIK